MLCLLNISLLFVYMFGMFNHIWNVLDGPSHDSMTWTDKYNTFPISGLYHVHCILVCILDMICLYITCVK
jgi:hypothetical protein